MSGWRSVAGIAVGLVWVLGGCERPAAPVLECSNGNYRESADGSGTCVCIDHRWQCGDQGGAAGPAEASGSLDRSPREGSAAEGAP